VKELERPCYLPWCSIRARFSLIIVAASLRQNGDSFRRLIISTPTIEVAVAKQVGQYADSGKKNLCLVNSMFLESPTLILKFAFRHFKNTASKFSEFDCRKLQARKV
jgi:hypothetical protein